MIAPPAPAERLLRVESRLREKLCVAQAHDRCRRPDSAVAARRRAGASVDSPSSAASSSRRCAVGFWKQVRRAIRVGAPSPPSAASAAGFSPEFRRRRGHCSSPILETGVTAATTTISRAIADCASPVEAAVNDPRAREALQRLEAMAVARTARRRPSTSAPPARRERDGRPWCAWRESLARAPRHTRSRLAPLADAARAVASAPLGEGAERILETLAAAELPDEAWLRSIAAFGELNVRPSQQAG